VRTVYIKQKQIELSACIIGANPNALAKAYRAGCLSEEDLDKLSRTIAKSKVAATSSPGAAAGRRRMQSAILTEIQRCL
jgi:hypothetical protein